MLKTLVTHNWSDTRLSEKNVVIKKEQGTSYGSNRRDNQLLSTDEQTNLVSTQGQTSVPVA